MQIQFKGKRVAIEKIKTSDKSKDSMGGIIVVPQQEEYSGVVRFVGPDVDPSIRPGAKVYFSTNYQQFRIQGRDLCVMNESEIVAVEEV